MDYGYIAYIDEAGDPGLNRVRPIDDNGASEWLILSAVVMKAKREDAVVEWVDEIRTGIGVTQRRDLHYRDLSPTRKLAVAERMSALPLRAFAICSNKKNMRGHVNTRAAKIPSQQWFYNWCVRLLLERVTDFCEKRCEQDYGERRLIKIEFSQRGGHRYSQTKAYHFYLGFQQEGGKVYLQKRQPVAKMLSTDLMFDYPHFSRAGLQLADAVASAFYQATDCLGPGQWNTAPAMAMEPIMAKENGAASNYGVALFPTPPWKGELTVDQQAIFKAYGYDFGRW
ncbi:MAG: DUF3800 domain-containing protein [Pseudomonadota bacterium]|nr:DUF3800 domain-containing protein [Pseudomonadota bacterium]